MNLSCPQTSLLLLTVTLFALPAPAQEKAPARGETIVNSLGMKLLPIAPGRFVMGTSDLPPQSQAEFDQRDYDESPAHQVTISRPFHLGATEVTNAQYEQFDPKHKTRRGLGNVSKADDEPVTYVTWQQTCDFCAWLTKKEGRPYRLPTEAEWEYACRAGTTTVFTTGEELTAAAANLGVTTDDKPRPTTMKVASFPPNAWGLFDLHGNVEEWCHDWYGPYPATEQTDPVGAAEGIARVVRGGSYNGRKRGNFVGSGRYCRSANRGGYLPDDANRAVGFRVVLGELPKSQPLASTGQKPAGSGPLPTKLPSVDPSQPYFDNFLSDNRRATIPANSWGPVYSAWNHFAAVCSCPNGDILAAWYTTKSEEGRELAQGFTRLRAGTNRWEPAACLLDIPDMNDHAPVLLTAGERIFHFFGQGLKGWDDAAIAVRTSDDSGNTWTPARIIWSREEGVKLSQPCSAVALPGGTLVLAIDGDNHRHERLLTSSDHGQSWQLCTGDLREACDKKYAIHPALFVRKDHSLGLFLRGPNPLPLLVTADLGQTWKSIATPLPGVSVGQKSAALRLASGAVVLVSADSTRKIVGGPTYVALSPDDGATWTHVRKLDDLGGYLALTQAPNGVIYAFGSRQSVAAFNEAWLKQGPPIP
ncbi:Serine/threonine-protein kinase pkn1 [Anatilimnocola aggregata]|uniref:Serine/threonine-protein kinase pkn1 n=1 Tax=Anatilimnocola aggregata TaxID=2528021 RepID=A0A517Y5Q5_9BACT|nr:SUMF1/EgtB/PvdO family nonheme iron enzyme [Anatilimnocola aggregata]QDU25536.1 Serine/threonine-protein kinase pkn1 [Anatilimnocola aggregata]